jgi:PAS domain S-box-containing protein
MAEERALEMTAALREAEARWRFAIEGAGDGLWDWNVPQSTVFFSKRWKEMLGFSEAEIGNALDEWSQRIHPDDTARVMFDVNAHLNGNVPTYVNEHRVLCKDGSYKWILDRGMIVQHDTMGKPLRMIGMHTDITALKEVEIALRTSELAARAAEDESHALLDALQLQKFALDEHAIVAATDVQGKINYVNDKFCQISGYAREELMGQDHLMVNSGTHPHGFFKAMYRTVSGGNTWHGEICNRTKNGELYWVDTTIVPVMSREGKPEQYLSIRSDITLRKQVELDLMQQQLTLEQRVKQKTQAARLSEQHLRLVMNTSLDAIVGMDSNGCVTDWSHQAEVTFGWTQAEVKGQPLHDFIIPERYREAHTKGLARFLEGGVGVVLGKRIEMSALRRDGNEIPVELAISPIVTPKGTSFSAFISDVTERKHQQAALVTARAAAEAASQAKSDFLAHMSHEIRTPMNGVVGMVDILRETPLLPEQQRMLETVQQSALALLDILNDILDFSKIEAGKLQVESIPTHVLEVAQGAVQLVHAVSVGRAVQLSVFVVPALPQWFLCDPTRLRQVLLNLLGNAVKFSAAQGHGPAQVALRVEPCTLTTGLDGVRFSVRDNGIGMSAEVQQRLFQPFMQADESMARKFGGTGLGLSITQHLVELMGGRMSVHSTLGKGSEFVVELALQACEPGRKLPALPSLAGAWVVAITPDANSFEDIAEVVTAYAQAAGAMVTTVTDLSAARSLLQQQPTRWADCVVLVPVNEATPTAALKLPARVGVVRSILRGSDQFDADIRLASQPLLQGDLLTAIARAKNRWVPQVGPGVPERRSKVRATAPTVEEAVQAQQLILLAEDNATNRKVMQQQLGLLGYSCEVAEDGAVALHLWQSQPGRYALLLSDCHMPVLDGFGLTAAIRAAEAQSGATRLPIIAVTANAMQGEAQRCFERGMDDYLSKPLRMQELSALLSKWVPGAGVAAASNQPVPERPVQSTDGADPLPVWNPDTLRNLVGDDLDLLQDLLQEFLRNAQQQTSDIVAAAATQDTAKLADAAHTLKSAARSVGALALGELCQSLETTGRAGDRLQCTALAAGLMDALAAAAAEIDGHLGL